MHKVTFHPIIGIYPDRFTSDKTLKWRCPSAWPRTTPWNCMGESMYSSTHSYSRH